MTKIEHAPGKIIYCNGMTTTEESALKHALEIERLTGVEVELHHNDTTPTDKAQKIAAKIGLGVCGAGYAISSEKKSSEKKMLDGLIGAASVFSLISAASDYIDIQKQKSESAQTLAGKVINYLTENPLAGITLIFHSQGADIGQMALARLAHYKLRDRIHVITIGGMVDIPNYFAKRVVNFRNDGDLISQLAKRFFTIYEGPKNRLILDGKDCDSFSRHHSADYLKQGPVRQAIREFSAPY